MQQVRKKNEGNRQKNTRYGDTIVEAVIAIAIYSVVAVLALASMNSGLKTAQTNLETTMARATMDAQADALRYIYENYVLTKIKNGETDSGTFSTAWGSIASRVREVKDEDGMRVTDYIKTSGSCSQMIENDDGEFANRSFVLNPRALYSKKNTVGRELSGARFSDYGPTSNVVITNEGASDPNKPIKPASLYPRLVYKPQKGEEDEFDGILIGSNEGADEKMMPSRNLKSAEGVWIVGLKNTGGKIKDSLGNNYSYDFYVRTCWNASGESSPSIFTTVVRLYKVD